MEITARPTSEIIYRNLLPVSSVDNTERYIIVTRCKEFDEMLEVVNKQINLFLTIGVEVTFPIFDHMFDFTINSNNVDDQHATLQYMAFPFNPNNMSLGITNNTLVVYFDDKLHEIKQHILCALFHYIHAYIDITLYNNLAYTLDIRFNIGKFDYLGYIRCTSNEPIYKNGRELSICEKRFNHKLWETLSINNPSITNKPTLKLFYSIKCNITSSYQEVYIQGCRIVDQWTYSILLTF